MEQPQTHTPWRPVERVKSWAAARVDEKTTHLANKTEPLVRALNSAATRLDEDGATWLAGRSRRAANHLHHASAYLSHENAATMLADLSSGARAHPATFVWASFAAGLLLGRILRAPAPPRDDAFGIAGPGAPLSSPPLGGA